MQIQNPTSMVDHLLRQTRVHHVQLSAMADVKANMMLTVASVVLTYTVGYLADPAFQWGAFTLILFCMASVVAAIFATMPRVPLPGKSGGHPDLNGTHFNLLFFGSFIHMSYEEFNESMEKLLNQPGEAVDAMVREIYTLGTFLAYKKYRYLRLTYMIFMYEMIASVLLYEIFMAMG
ncbi:MAG: DUF5706 domain-containing protein [Candidatus Hydrogenedentes bacterium]|nr:DUF5706 domain-containing protein [Candidatus Hydrogenedentota bacterium]